MDTVLLKEQKFGKNILKLQRYSELMVRKVKEGYSLINLLQQYGTGKHPGSSYKNLSD